MHRIDSPHSIKNKFHVAAVGSIDDDPTTEFTTEWLNAVQEELVAVVEGFGRKIDKNKNDQIATILSDLKKEINQNISDAISQLKTDAHAELEASKNEIRTFIQNENSKLLKTTREMCQSFENSLKSLLAQAKTELDGKIVNINSGLKSELNSSITEIVSRLKVLEDEDFGGQINSASLTINALADCANKIRPEFNYLRYVASRAFLCFEGPYSWKGTSYREDLEYLATAPKRGLQDAPEGF